MVDQLGSVSGDKRELRHQKNCLRGFRPGPTLTHLAVQSQKMARGLKFHIQEVEEFYLCSENNTLISCAAPLFWHMQKADFLMTRLKEG